MLLSNYFRQFLVDYQADLFLELIDLGQKCEHWIAESLGLPYQNVGGIRFNNCGRGITKPKVFWN